MQQFDLNTQPLAAQDAIVLFHNARFTVLSSTLIRIEYSDTQSFEDRASQVFWYRHQPVPSFTVQSTDNGLEILTDSLKLSYTGAGVFNEDNLKIELLQSGETWFWGKKDRSNLLGTARTLDEVSGFTVLEDGLISRAGWVAIDDSHTLVFDDADWLVPRETIQTDVYFFGYGDVFQQGLNDYFAVAGHIPLIPRWVLGNWWSRYWEYTQEELTGLMLQFETHDVPLSVCVVDMDWHLTDTGNESNGWTGYTWNKDLFPDPEAFMAFLHQHGIKTSLNLHPAAGVYPHEEQYKAFANFMDVRDGEPIPFQIGDKKFAQAYFELLHHPHENQGVDFWWIDWQQGKNSGVHGLDPLWWLNHLHFYDLARDGEKRPFVFSRWGGLGNHRYPIGFSGDALVDWESLAFQPYFTSTAANVGYGWWSHDIGGHMGGVEDPELYVRWVQFGVFSPIFRLHSTKNPFHERLPWGYDIEIFRISKSFMQLRHALIPYLYSMVWQTSKNGRQLIRPMYHDYPNQEQAYHAHNQYTFGTELIAAPVIQPIDPDIGLGRQIVWFPEHEGGWFNFFDGSFYPANEIHSIFCKLEEIPVFAKAGAIVPLSEVNAGPGVENPDALVVHVFPNANGYFELYEDDGSPSGAQFSTLRFETRWTETEWRLTVHPITGDTDHVPANRSIRFEFISVNEPDEIYVSDGGEARTVNSIYDVSKHRLEIDAIEVTPSSHIQIRLSRKASLLHLVDTRAQVCEKLIRHFKMNTWAKAHVYHHMPKMLSDAETIKEIIELLNSSQRRALLEVLLGAGVEFITNIDDKNRPVLIWNNSNLDLAHTRYTQWHGWKGIHVRDTAASTFEVIERDYGWHRQVVNFNYADWWDTIIEL